MKLVRQTGLRFKQGEKSDKVYEVDLLEAGGDGYLVNFRYGKFGAVLREGSKTKDPVAWAKAEKVADSLLVSKINKGYRVTEGYDPVSGETIGVGVSGADNDLGIKTEFLAPFSTAERDQRILERIAKFADGNKHVNGSNEGKTVDYIDGYSLSRSLWKAGELRIQGVVPVIKKLLTSSQWSIDKEENTGITAHTMIWALGRSGDKAALPVVKQLGRKLPKNLRYLLEEVQFALSDDPRSLVDCEYASDDVFAMAKTINNFAAIESLSFSALDQDERTYHWLVLEQQGVAKSVREALKPLSLDSLGNKDDLGEDDFETYLPTKTRQVIEANKAAFPQLEDAIVCLFEHQRNQLIIERLDIYQVVYDQYMGLISKIDLGRLFKNDEHGIQNARNARLDWMWGNDERKLKKALVKAGHVGDINNFWDRVEKYSELKSEQGKDISSTKLDECWAIVQQAEVGADVQQKLSQLTLDQNQYHFTRHQLSPVTRSKFESDISDCVESLFNDRLATLREEALKPKQQLLENYGREVIQLYRSILLHPEHRTNALGAIQHTPIDQSFTAIARQLYKTAEFRDDGEVLALLNYRIENTHAPNHTYWGNSSPFSRTTKDYFRRRLLRTLRNIAKFSPDLYTQYARHVLILADDQSELAKTPQGQQTPMFPQLSALNFILHHNSRRYQPGSQLIWYLDDEVREGSKPEAYPELWDQAHSDLLAILLACKAQQVNNFACKRLSKAADFCAQVKQDDWLVLVLKPYKNTALLALNYLTEQLYQAKVLETVLNAQFSVIRKQALEHIQGEKLGGQRDLLLLMLLSAHDDVYQFARQYLYTAQEHYSELSGQLLDALLASNETEQAYLLPRIEWLLLNPMQNSAALNKVVQLLEHPALKVQQLATILLAASDYSFTELQAAFQVMSDSPHAEIRAGAIALLAKLSFEEQQHYQDLLFAALLDEHAAIRQQATVIVVDITDQPFKLAAFQHVLPSLFLSEPVDGFSEDMQALIAGLRAIHVQVDTDVVWRLLNARSKMAERCGAIILPAHPASVFSPHQLALLSKSPTLSVRDWALAIFENDHQLVHEHYPEVIRILDNRWDDTRQRAIQLFSTHFDDAFWTTERVIAVCDNVYDDVQYFGRSLVTRFFTQDKGETYLMHLSQHPSANVQLFVSGFLKEYASNQPQIIIALELFFNIVLSQVNQGRLVKDRVIRFLFAEAQKDQQVAEMVARLFSDQSISMVIADKAQYIKTLFDIQAQFNHIATPVTRIAPEVRAV